MPASQTDCGYDKFFDVSKPRTGQELDQLAVDVLEYVDSDRAIKQELKPHLQKLKSYKIKKSTCGANTGSGGVGFGPGNTCAGGGSKAPTEKVDSRAIKLAKERSKVWGYVESNQHDKYSTEEGLEARDFEMAARGLLARGDYNQTTAYLDSKTEARSTATGVGETEYDTIVEAVKYRAGEMFLEQTGMSFEEARSLYAKEYMTAGHENQIKLPDNVFANDLSFVIRQSFGLTDRDLDIAAADVVLADPEFFSDRQVEAAKNAFLNDDDLPEQYFDLVDEFKDRMHGFQKKIDTAMESGDQIEALAKLKEQIPWGSPRRHERLQGFFNAAIENIPQEFTNTSPQESAKQLSADQSVVYGLINSSAAKLENAKDPGGEYHRREYINEDGEIKRYDDVAPMFKQSIAKSVAERFAKIPDDDFKMFLESSKLYRNEQGEPLILFLKDKWGIEDDREFVAAYITNQWAKSSTDHNENSVAIQLAIADKFDFTIQDTVHGSDEATLNAARSFLKRNKKILKTYIDAVYEDTQKQLKEAGIEKIVLFRGMGLQKTYSSMEYDQTTPAKMRVAKELAEITNGDGNSEYYVKGQDKWNKTTWIADRDVETNPISSYSADYQVASAFTGYKDFPTILATEVDAKDVFSSFMTGFGSMAEGEFVVLGRPRKAKMIILDVKNGEGVKHPGTRDDAIAMIASSKER